MKAARQDVSKTYRYIKQESPELGEDLRVDDWCHFWSLALSRGFMAQSFRENVSQVSVWKGFKGLNPFKSEMIPFVTLHLKS